MRYFFKVSILVIVCTITTSQYVFAAEQRGAGQEFDAIHRRLDAVIETQQQMNAAQQRADNARWWSGFYWWGGRIAALAGTAYLWSNYGPMSPNDLRNIGNRLGGRADAHERVRLQNLQGQIGVLQGQAEQGA